MNVLRCVHFMTLYTDNAEYKCRTATCNHDRSVVSLYLRESKRRMRET